MAIGNEVYVEVDISKKMRGNGVYTIELVSGSGWLDVLSSPDFYDHAENDDDEKFTEWINEEFPSDIISTYSIWIDST